MRLHDEGASRRFSTAKRVVFMWIISGVCHHAIQGKKDTGTGKLGRSALLFLGMNKLRDNGNDGYCIFLHSFRNI